MTEITYYYLTQRYNIALSIGTRSEPSQAVLPVLVVAHSSCASLAALMLVTRARCSCRTMASSDPSCRSCSSNCETELAPGPESGTGGGAESGTGGAGAASGTAGGAAFGIGGGVASSAADSTGSGLVLGEGVCH